MTVKKAQSLEAAASEPTLSPQRKAAIKMKSREMRRRVEARQIAEHYLNNGLNFHEAFFAVTGKKPKKNDDPFKCLGDASIDFLRGIDKALAKVKIRKDALVKILWAGASSSPLDFLHDDGTPMTVADLKQLPREIQAIIEEVDVQTSWLPVRDNEGKIMMLADGRPALRREERVRLRIIDKAKAQRLFAELKKWIGQSIVLSQKVNNVAVLVQQMDSQRERLRTIYEAAAPKEKET
jgi:hypothetical protein